MSPDGTSSTDLGVRLGANWYGGAPLSQFGGLTLQRRLTLGQTTSLSFGAGIERINRRDAASRSSTVARLFGTWSRARRNDTRLSLSATATNATSASFLTDNRALSLTGALRFFKTPLGTDIGLSLSYVARDYRQPVPFFGTRRDRTTTLGLDVTLQEQNYYGFAPTLGISASSTASSVDLYDSETIGIRLGLRSVF